MSTAKRSRRRQTEARAPSPLPASKRLKTTPTSHVPTKSGLGFLVDEDARAGKKLDARLTNGIPSSKTNRVDESHAVVAPPARTEDGGARLVDDPREVIDISSAEEHSSEDEDEEESGDEEDAHPNGVAIENGLANGHVGITEDEGDDDEDEELNVQLVADNDRMEGVAMQLVDTGEEKAEVEPEEPSFGDMLQARHPEPIDVQASFTDPIAARSAMVPTARNQPLTAPSAGSLSTVLTQALKTNDRDLLESCFQVNDLPSIRSTIERIQPQLASSLLQRLAERIYKRPGRTGNLMVWVQWSLVAHGGYLAAQPDLMRKLRSVAQVARERAQGLQPLLHLKGKLDLLTAQLEMRRGIQAASRAAHADEEDNEDGVVYVEGQDDDWSDDADVGTEDRPNGKLLEPAVPNARRQRAASKFDVAESEDEDVDGDEVRNGVAADSDDASSEDEVEEDGENMIDVEAEETSEDDGDEEAPSDEDDDSAPESEEETDPSDDDSEPEIKPPQPKTLNRRR